MSADTTILTPENIKRHPQKLLIIGPNHFFPVVVELLVYFAFLFFNETIITKTQGLVVVIAKRKYIN